MCVISESAGQSEDTMQDSSGLASLIEGSGPQFVLAERNSDGGIAWQNEARRG